MLGSRGLGILREGLFVLGSYGALVKIFENLSASSYFFGI